MRTKDKKCKRCPYRKDDMIQIFLNILCLTLTLISTILDTIRFFYS